ncbi:hypothetical protein [Myroides odoratus]|uniref:Lipocalin-like domain-containing protein n=1 Tax=Myroides odoratus TaxID=256 RepID=A0A378U2X4_MYROD|nr:hypothetical protein [Myroides odoratus]STZ69629.1 Uncharacterised protein [Myroides odoratus]
MKKPLLLLCLIASMLTINSCNSTDDNDGPPATKEALKKKLQGRWERYKVVNIYTQQELSVEEYDFNSLFFLDFGTLNTIFLNGTRVYITKNIPLNQVVTLFGLLVHFISIQKIQKKKKKFNI